MNVLKQLEYVIRHCIDQAALEHRWTHWNVTISFHLENITIGNYWITIFIKEEQEEFEIEFKSMLTYSKKESNFLCSDNFLNNDFRAIQYKIINPKDPKALKNIKDKDECYDLDYFAADFCAKFLGIKDDIRNLLEIPCNDNFDDNDDE